MEKPEVFEAAHGLVLRLLAEGKVDGLRIDHPDGLYDPEQYLRRLQEYYVLACVYEAFVRPGWRGRDWKELEGPLLEMIGEAGPDGAPVLPRCPLYVVVEKILGTTEQLPPDWDPRHQRLRLPQPGQRPVRRPGRREAIDEALPAEDRDSPFAEVVYRNKLLILQIVLSSELHMLTNQLDRLAQKDRSSRDFTFNGLRLALGQVIACFPVYRSYIADEGVHDPDRQYIEAPCAGPRRGTRR